jgi:hypothetical protein
LVAQTIVDGENVFSVSTNDWAEGSALLLLAEPIASGDGLQEKIAESRRINDENLKSGNDWCSPGYWDLPDTTIEALEAARLKAMSGDFDGALDFLIVLDSSIGKPLKRCVAYALSMKAVRITNAAFDELNTEYGSIKKIMDRLRAMNEDQVVTALSHQPNPYSESFYNPPCLCHGRSDYTSWVTFTYRDIPLFMCSACNEQHKRETEKRESALRVALNTSLELLLLASEIDGNDPGIKKNLKTLKDRAREYSAQIPTTRALKDRLAAKTDRFEGVSAGSVSPEAGALCHFCDQESPDQSSAISVRMSGDLHTGTCLFGSRVQFSHVDIVVPRCRACSDQHRHLVARTLAWRSERARAGAHDRFPDQLGELDAARDAVRTCDEQIATARQTVARSRPDGMRKALIAAYALAALGALYVLFLQVPEPMSWGALQIEALSGWNSDEGTLYLPIAVAGFLGPLLGWRLGRSLHRGWSRRLLEASAALTAAEAERTRAISAVEAAEARLDAARSDADAAYLAAHPQPELPSGVKPEAAYVAATPIKIRETQGWSIGMLQGSSQSHQVVREPTDVRGLVGELA